MKGSVSIGGIICGEVELSAGGGWLVGEVADLACAGEERSMAACREWSPVAEWSWNG